MRPVQKSNGGREHVSAAVADGSARAAKSMRARPLCGLPTQASGGKPGIRGNRFAWGAGVTFFSIGCGGAPSSVPGAGVGGGVVGAAEGTGVGVPYAGGEIMPP